MKLVFGPCVRCGMVVDRRSRCVTLLLLLLALFIVVFPTPLRSFTQSASTASQPRTATSRQLSEAPNLSSNRARFVPVATSKRSPNITLTQDMYIGGYEDPHGELCPMRGRRLRLVALVASAPAHAAARAALRLTWMHYAARADVAVAFVLGAPPPALRRAIRAEDALYGDVIVGRWTDSYSNLTLKTLSMLEWVAEYCPSAPRLLKVDDDMFINIPRLLNVIEDESRVNATKTIWGRIIYKAPVVRSTKSKFYVPRAEYPAQFYPDYADGPAYVMTTDCIADLLASAPVEPYLRIEDAFVTGVLASKVNISRKHIADFIKVGVKAKPCEIQKALAVHRVQYQQQFEFWGKLNDVKAKCGK